MTDEEILALDTSISGNGNTIYPLKRMELVYDDIDIKFAINPSDYTQKEPNRVNITQTKGGAWIDAWGAGIVEFNIKGITGVTGNTKLNKSGTPDIDEGYRRWKALRDMFRTIYNDVQDGQTVTNLVKFYNWTDNEFWYCYPTASGIELYRSRSKPHIYQYTINLWGLRRIGEPEVTTGVIGNPYSEEEIGDVAVENNTNTDEDNASDGANAEGNGTDGDTTDETPPGESDDSSNQTTSQDKANTSQGGNSSVSGGTAYITKAAQLDTQADVTTITNTRTKNVGVIRAQAEKYAKALSPIIGGYSGLLVPTTAYAVAKDLQISQHGVVLYVNGFNQDNFLRNPDLQSQLEELDPNRLLEEMIYAPVVSVETYELWTLINEYSPTVLTPDLIHPIGSTPKERIMQTIENSKYYGSTLYSLIAQYRPKYLITKTEIIYLNIIMIESMMVYRQLWNISQATGKLSSTLTVSNLDVLIRNIQALIIYLEFNSTDTTIFYVQNIMWELRQIEATMHQIKTDIVEYL